MHFPTIILTLLASGVTATPAEKHTRRQTSDYTPCGDTLYSEAQCCSVNVLDIADLDCGSVSSTPTDAENFQATCAETGDQAMCCTLVILEIGVLCQTPTGL